MRTCNAVWNRIVELRKSGSELPDAFAIPRGDFDALNLDARPATVANGNAQSVTHEQRYRNKNSITVHGVEIVPFDIV